jgi:transcriptional regulator with GAF, ATPase, and Fis domain
MAMEVNYEPPPFRSPPRRDRRCCTRRGGTPSASADHMTPSELYDQSLQLRAQANEVEAEAVVAALREANGRVSRAAAILGIPHGRLRALLETGRLRSLSHLAARIEGRPPAKVA